MQIQKNQNTSFGALGLMTIKGNVSNTARVQILRVLENTGDDSFINTALIDEKFAKVTVARKGPTGSTQLGELNIQRRDDGNLINAIADSVQSIVGFAKRNRM